MKHHEEDDFDEQLQQLAPILRLHSEFRKHLRQVLRTQLSKRRPNRLIMPLLIVLSLGIIYIAVHKDRIVGSDLSSKPSGVSVTGRQISPSLPDVAVHSADPTTCLDDAESYHEVPTVRQKSLQSVTGWTVAGQTFFFAYYADDLDTAVRTATSTMDSFSALPPSRFREFLRVHAADVLVRVGRHEAEMIGAEDRIFDTVPVRFTKWRVTYPKWGHVVYWAGIPLISSKFP